MKGLLSRTAGLRRLQLLARIGTRDATNSFKAYSTDFVRAVGIDSRAGFEIGIELTAKARRMRMPVAEIPTIWLDRQAGVSNFKVANGSPVTYAGTGSRSVPGSPPSRSGTTCRDKEGSRTATCSRSHQGRARAGPDGEGARQRVGRVHRRLRRRGAARRGYEVIGGQLLQVREGHEVLRRPPSLPARRGRRAGHRADDQAAGRLRPFHRGRSDDRRHLVLPHLRLRPARDERADHRRVLRRRDRRAPGRPAAEGHLPVLVDGLRERRRRGRRYEGSSGRYRRRCRPTASRSWRWSTSPGPPGTSTGCRTPSCAVQLRGHRREPGPGRRRRSCPATSSSR